MRRHTTSDGASIAFADEGAGRPFLLLHGWGAHGGFFHEVRAALSTRVRVITPDLRGHRFSPDDPARLTIDRLAHDVVDLIEALDLADTIVVGWSMGAMLAWRALTLGAAPRVSGAVTIDMSAKIANDETWRFGMRGGQDRATLERYAPAMGADWPAYCRHFTQCLFAEGRGIETASLAEQALHGALDNDPAQLAPLWLSLVRQDMRAMLSAVSTPMLIVHGAQSQLYDENAAIALQRIMPGARRLTYARSGHAPHMEEPARFAADIEDFAESLKAARGKGAPP
jgi:pimeloyl-[acyl-carrier protein] methyl ester esterase